MCYNNNEVSAQAPTAMASAPPLFPIISSNNVQTAQYSNKQREDIYLYYRYDKRNGRWT